MFKLAKLTGVAALLLALACGDGDEGAGGSAAGPGVWVSSYMLFKYNFMGEQKLQLGVGGTGMLDCRSSDGLVWLLCPDKLVKISDEGGVLQTIPLPSPFHAYAPPSVNQVDGSVWFAAGDPMGPERRVFCYNVDGNKTVDKKIEAPTYVACYKGDGSCWVAYEYGLMKLSRTGKVLKKVETSAVSSIAVDQRDGAIWAAMPLRLEKYNADGEFLMSIALGADPEVVAVNPTDGAVAVLAEASNDTYKLMKFNARGQKKWTLAGFKSWIGDGLSFNPDDGSVWVLDLEGYAGGRVVKVSPSGQKLLTVNLPSAAVGLAVRP